MWTNILLLILGLLLLISGGEFLVKSAISIAKKFNISPFVVGITIVSFGTSAPELMVSLQATFDGATGLAIGNVIGSNIANIGLVLGLTVLVKPIIVEKSKYVFSAWFMLISALLFSILLYDGNISFTDGLLLVLGLLIFLLFSFKYDKSQDVEDDFVEKGILTTLMFFVLGSVGLYFGSDIFVNNAICIAKDMGVSEFVIGITIVAFGTSLPELVTSIVAAVRNQNSISIGNLIGSNIFNIFAVIGITSLIQPLQQNSASITGEISLFIMILFSIIMGLYLIGKKISRLKGLILLAGYLIYIIFNFI